MDEDLLFYYFDDFFINFCVIITITVIYMLLRTKLKIGEKSFYQRGTIDGIVGGLFGIVLMIFSVEVAENALIDLRFIPVMILVLFTGSFPAVIGCALIIIGRFMLGDSTSYAMTTPILMVTLVIGFVLIHKLYQPHRATYKKALLMILFSDIVFIAIMLFHFHDLLQLMSFVPIYSLISFIAGLSATFFIKHLSKTEYLLSKYQEEVATDFLTGLQNMRSFEQIWSQSVHRSITKKESLSLLTIDIDYFKQINDTYGHPAGNQILSDFSHILLRNIRSFDIAFRNGGDEFSIILPGCPHVYALEVAERIRKEVEEFQFEVSMNQVIPITVCIGVATYPDTCSDYSQIIHTADESLYKAKKLGKNKVYPFETETPLLDEK